MTSNINGCDYLILTASNGAQADIYRKQLDIRRQLGLLAGIEHILVVPDIQGKRIGSGGSTLCCLMEVLKAELGKSSNDLSAWKKVLEGKKVLIIHAGGDSKRLGIYSACGKLFIPIPGQWDSPIPLTLFDKQLPCYLGLFDRNRRAAQFMITSGDVLLRFKTDPPESVPGTVTGFCCPASPEQASRHGVFCLGPDSQVRLYLQKPSCEQQLRHQALNHYHQAMLDIGIMAFDNAAAIEMLKMFELRFDARGELVFEGRLAQAVLDHGLDFYRELCCAFGTEASAALHRESAVGSGSTWPVELLSELFDKARSINFKARSLARCDFLDFGSVKQIINSGYRLLQEDASHVQVSGIISLNNSCSPQSALSGSSAWVEGCTLHAHLDLAGNNVVTGVNLSESLCLGQGQCLDLAPGRNAKGEIGWFVRCYHPEDDFKKSQNENPQYCGMPLGEWLSIIGARESDIWPENSNSRRELFTARLFPFIKDHGQFREFLWMFDPNRATAEQMKKWKTSDRFSHKDISRLTDSEAFLLKRLTNRINTLTDRASYLFRPESTFSDLELDYVLKAGKNNVQFIGNALTAAFSCFGSDSINQQDVFISSRILHSLGSAIERANIDIDRIRAELKTMLSPSCADWLESLGVSLAGTAAISEWASRMKDAAFNLHGKAIIKTGLSQNAQPRSRLRADEIVWVRAPARLDIAGGWTDTPPYALEWGGAVLNAAVNLNGQPPIQAYLRVIPEPVIKIGSIDLGLQVVITSWDELTNYRDVTSGFSLAKAALLQEVFSASALDKPAFGRTLEAFGGGIELTTLAAIPKGSGLGTSSIMGAVIVAALNCAMGKALSNRELFHSVLRLEQTLTTGGGWQDQIGGVLEGVKLILTEPGLVANPSMQYLRKDVIDPSLNGGRTVLYYTGITRLAKNILRQVVGRYLNRDHHAMQVLEQIRQAALDGAEIIGSKDYAKFGSLLDRSWQLNKQLDPNSSNEQVEELFKRISPHVYGAKLLGAGGGGFVLMACKSQEGAAALREDLTEHPCDPNARFFSYDISSEGLVVSVC